MRRECAACCRCLPQTFYTANHYVLGPGVWRCTQCVRGHYSDTSSARQSNAGRLNHSESAEVLFSALQEPFAQRTFRWVAKGTYCSGPREGQTCVVKWFKSGASFSEDYFKYDIKAVDKALEFIDTFNRLGIVNKTVKINVPQVWETQEDGHPAEWSGQNVLCEPYIQNYQKFNSNSGWSDESRVWGEVMQALSHFSYHQSGGNFVLCDLQGGIYQHEIVLSDPVILSRDRQYGVTDLGPDGINSFFARHECNNFCRSHWARPNRPRQHFRPTPRTTMMRRTVPTAYSRPYETSFYG